MATQALIEKAYIYGVIDRNTLLIRLVARGLSEEDAELSVQVLEAENPDVFGEERDVYLKQPSLASLQLALQRGILSEASFRARLEAQGYSLDAIEIALFNAQYQAAAVPKQLTRADIMSLYRKQVIGRAETQRRLLQVGYTMVDIDLLVQAEELTLLDTRISDLFIMGFIDASGFVALATEAGYTAEELEDYFIRLEAGEFG